MGGHESWSGPGDKGNNPVPDKHWVPFCQPFDFFKMCGKIRICTHTHTRARARTHTLVTICYSDLPPISCCLAAAVSML